MMPSAPAKGPAMTRTRVPGRRGLGVEAARSCAPEREGLVVAPVPPVLLSEDACSTVLLSEDACSSLLLSEDTGSPVLLSEDTGSAMFLSERAVGGRPKVSMSWRSGSPAEVTMRKMVISCSGMGWGRRCPSGSGLS